MQTGQGLIDKNMYAYCMNNPVLYTDPDGTLVWIPLVIGVVAGLIVGVVAVQTAKTVHYDVRDDKNNNPPKPDTQKKADDAGWVGSNDNDKKGVPANAHQFTSPDKKNVKYVSPDGKQEIIFDAFGKIVIDPRDIGTYNFIPSNQGIEWLSVIGHSIVDVAPWLFWGNSVADTTFIWDRWGMLWE